jgi:protein-tyrosine phosphatase
MSPGPHRILCVCLGNICRSPTGEAVLRAHLHGAEIDSAGTGGWHVGDPPYGPAIAAAARRGHDLSPQRARQVETEDFHRFDLILAMDRQNLADLRALAPADARAQVTLFLDPVGGGDVPDPYYTRDFDGALDLIERAAERLGGAAGLAT